MRLPGCEKWHPDAPSEIVPRKGSESVFRKRDGGYERQGRPICKLCRRLRAKSKKTNLRLGKSYGVIPLNWIPPERL